MLIDSAIKLLSRLPIRDRFSGQAVPFKLNPNQAIAVQRLKEQEAVGQPLRWCCLKARRVGMSSLTEGLMFAHILSSPMQNGKVVAHLDDSVAELFKVPLGLTSAIREQISESLLLEPTQTKITAAHPRGNSYLSIATAGSTQGGRGGGNSALHLSEVAFYRGGDSLISLLSTVPNHKDTIICVESTANGKVGGGEAFYQFWKAAQKGETDFIPIFLSWLDDASCIRNPEEAKDAPINQDEKDLIKHFGANKAQLAWRRWALYNLCSGYVEKLYAEYPSHAEEAFVATGNPAFIKEELSAARASVRDGVSIHWSRTDNKKIEFQPGGNGSLVFFERPKEGHSYRIGVDAARGEELTSDGKSKSAGDFAAATVIDASTMEVVARFADRVSPGIFAELLNTLGRYYNNAMMCIELTGGWGAWVQTLLRDNFNYPFFYMWKGFDDKARAPKAARNQMGWKTTVSSREKLFTAFREALREQDLQVRDVQCVTQMEQAERVTGRWEVKKGHDDVLFSQLLANIAVQHYPASRLFGKPKNTAEDDTEEQLKSVVNWKPGHEVALDAKGVFIHEMLTKHVKDLELGSKLKGRVQPLQGI